MVYQLRHRFNKDEEAEHDGCGFVIMIDASPVFVTCKHNFTENEGAASHIWINEQEIPTGLGQEGFFMASFDGARMINLSIENQFVHNDYAFQNLNIPIDDLHVIDLIDPNEIEGKRPLFLHSINTDDQVQVGHSCSQVFEHDGMEENIWAAFCSEATGGHSGGAICTLENELVGFLISGVKSRITLIKAKTIVPFYRYLKEI
jgi:hypothetical protein